MHSRAKLSERSVLHAHGKPDLESDILAGDDRYKVRIARDSTEVRSALRLRNEVFNREIEKNEIDSSDLEWDRFDFRSKHLLAIDKATTETIGTYRINSIESIGEIGALYSAAEFEVENLPADVILSGAEIGRACISARHRGSKALFLLWKGLARYLVAHKKRYLFGCCSIFTKDPSVGVAAYHQLVSRDAIHPIYAVPPKKGVIDINGNGAADTTLPHLFEMYLRLGAKVCGLPMYDATFGSVDYFVLFDLEQMSDRYRRIFLQ
jgi:putative hemolysin